MIKITDKTLKDLEFPVVCGQLSQYCVTDLGKEKALKLRPFPTEKEIRFSLAQTQEYKSSALQESTIPNHGFDPITEEIKLLNIKNTILEINGIRRIGFIAQTVNTHKRFFKKYQEIYPKLYETSETVEFTTFINDAIDKIINRFGEVKDDASPLLQQTRRAINRVRGKINSSFSIELSKYNSFGYLDEIKESVVENVRVLAVSAMHRRKVKGSILGNSKTGRIVYIQPEVTLQHSRELNNLQYEEHEEVKRILKTLTEEIRPYRELLIDYQTYLSAIDVVSAKTKYAESMQAILPKITKKRELQLKDAYHPLLYLTNKNSNKETFPQDINLQPDNRIIVISGPNAGGKSITLKTVGLLQIMLQSGMLIPVHEYSRMCFFDKILTDIGDNQSIENHLSTYSYRLKNMKYFLRKVDDKSLFLIDEFGTGSDPELGGALAETFLEVFYEKNAYGIITTHYANLKKMANETEGISNANMLFDARTLEPKFKLHLGEAGSSFTFEVAQKNGIPYSLINRSKKKVERGKIRFDKSIAKLQQERSKLNKTTTALKKKEEKATEEKEKLEETNQRIQQKLEGFQELYDSNQRMIHLGEKIDSLAENFFNNKNKKNLIGEFLKLIAIENSKRKKVNKKQKKQQEQQKKQLEKEAQKEVVEIRKKKKEEKKKEKAIEKEAAAKKVTSFKVNDRVRLEDSRAVGSIDKIEKKKAFVNYGMFTTEVDMSKLELVERAKK
ncbi:endonuclease MutS2 [Haloflavibacter putidus]|uniref:DNA mismatch repair protein MutS n=1 Tax=Haloflavibacter putidus TaxID=2576776 RepID=A0A507ZTH5_9FLAO|nr:DNA mismatch repair protein MutS [Haloflavibacter putidus]TQD40227.1 DNA mismatch repair protein MutS [Haloflavibacter putidus]